MSLAHRGDPCRDGGDTGGIKQQTRTNNEEDIDAMRGDSCPCRLDRLQNQC